MRVAVSFCLAFPTLPDKSMDRPETATFTVSSDSVGSLLSACWIWV